MKTYKEWLASTTLTLSLLATGTGILAQDKARPSAQQNVIRERDVVIATEGTPLPPEAMMGIVGAVNFNFISSEMSFDNKVVKGAAYSAEAVTETIQTLADGNRIVRKIAASVYRDGEGRTRREQALNHIGPFATNGDVPQTIFINDPVAGINYVLDPRSRIARKLAPPNFNFKPESLAFSMSNGGSRTPILNAGSHGRPHYPPDAKAAGIEGDVAVRVVINEAGEIVSATATEGPSPLRQAAVDAVKRWRTMPGNSNTGTGKTETVVNFKFSLPGSISYKFSLPGGRDYNFNFSEKADALMSKELKRTLPPLGSFPMIASSNELSHSTFPRHKPVTESLGKQT
ncbi:MAG: energy transducer TonB, partial [Pyrinomonadaceae bacterium]|nr:energy transducer TonB [Pyrinomonadaceae bacterium]